MARNRSESFRLNSNPKLLIGKWNRSWRPKNEEIIRKYNFVIRNSTHGPKVKILLRKAGFNLTSKCIQINFISYKLNSSYVIIIQDKSKKHFLFWINKINIIHKWGNISRFKKKQEEMSTLKTDLKKSIFWNYWKFIMIPRVRTLCNFDCKFS